MAKTRLEPIDGGRSPLGPMEVDDAPAPRRTNRPKTPTVSELAERESRAVLASMGAPAANVEAVPADEDRSTARVRLEAIRDRVRSLKANRAYWERLEYAQRQVLNGALACAEEVLCEVDDAGIPKTIERFLGLQFPRR